jgi:hypothetical protein
MYDGGKIVLGLAAFIALAAFPVWYANASNESDQKPDLVLPTNETECVESTEFMRASHMDLLDDWRDAVVRDGKREYVATDGRKWDKSLSRTCLGCHGNRQQFCDECHNYLGVDLSCWDCHVAPEGN